MGELVIGVAKTHCQARTRSRHSLAEEYFLVQDALTTLTLRPKFRESALELFGCRDLFGVDDSRSVFAMLWRNTREDTRPHRIV